MLSFRPREARSACATIQYRCLGLGRLEALDHADIPISTSSPVTGAGAPLVRQDMAFGSRASLSPPLSGRRCIRSSGRWRPSSKQITGIPEHLHSPAFGRGAENREAGEATGYAEMPALNQNSHDTTTKNKLHEYGRDAYRSLF
jgi:hypothetical protein